MVKALLSFFSVPVFFPFPYSSDSDSSPTPQTFPLPLLLTGHVPRACVRPGLAGPPALLGALLRGKLGAAWVLDLPAQAGFAAALVGRSPSGAPLLALATSRVPPVAAGGWEDEEEGSSRPVHHRPLRPPPRPARGIARVDVRCRCPAFAAAVAADPVAFVRTLCGGELVEDGPVRRANEGGW